MKYYAIIVGGGSGKRMQNTIAKQFLLLNDKPVLMHTLQAFYNSPYRPQIILVLPENAHAYWEDLCLKFHFNIPHTLVTGGEQRFHSVRSGLLTIQGEGIVAVHDAVRPLVNQRLIANAFETAADNGNAIACIKISDSVRKINADGTSKIVDREELLLIQTPQTFEVSQLRKAYQQQYEAKFTDDASVVENAGFNVHLINGDRNNIKITYPEDLEMASFLLK